MSGVSSPVSVDDGRWYGRMEYSPVSQIRRLPVVEEALSMRWFWGRLVGAKWTDRCEVVEIIKPHKWLWDQEGA